MKKVPILFAGIASISLLVMLNSCNRTEHHAMVKSPFQHVDVVFNQYEVSSVKETNLKLENGTKIHVPANAFIDANGLPVEKPVALHYREFHSTADIIASGIPMDYDSAGRTSHFESAGMFEMKADCNGEPVELAKGKQIDVQMASFKPGNQFNFYYFDKKSGNWNYMGTQAAETNCDKQKAQEALPAIPDKPIQPMKPDPNEKVLNLDVDYGLYPELKSFSGVMWQYAGDDPSKDPSQVAWLKEKSCDYMELKPTDKEKGIFSLFLRSGNKSMETEVKPVLSGKDYTAAKAKFEKQMNGYTAACKAREEEQTRVEQQGDLLRTFSVGQFGIYNWDCILSQPNIVARAADFEFDQPVDKSNMTVYLVSGDEKKVVQFYAGSWDKFSFNPNIKNTLIAVMPEDKLAVLGPQDFASETAVKSRKLTFHLKTKNKQIRSVAELDAVLKSI